MQKPIRLFLIATSAALLLSSFAPDISAQRNPNMPLQERDAQKERLYSTFSEHKRTPTAEQQRLAYEAAKEYLRTFGADSDGDVKAVRKFVADYESARGQYDLDTAFNARSYAKTFEVGRPLLQKNPDSFYVLGILAEAGYENALAGNASLNAETIQYAKKAIQLIDDGKVTTPDPFKSVDIARGFLNFALGNLVKDQSPVEAARAFLKAAQSDSPYHNDPLTYHRLGVSILKGEFAQLSAEYNEKYGNKGPSAEQKAMFDRINLLGERAIDAYARAVALSTRPEQQEVRNKILAQLTKLYQTFHNGSDAGLNEIIATVLTKPLP